MKRHADILDKLASSRGYHIAKTYYEVVSGESIATRPEVQKLLEEVSAGLIFCADCGKRIDRTATA